MNCLLLSMPGTPVIYYGDEIGMGDNIHLGDRDGVRTPMQWSPDRNGGFSRADPSRLVLPPIMDPLYGYEAVNVEAQAADPHSLLNWMRRAHRGAPPAPGVRPRHASVCSIRRTARCWRICANTTGADHPLRRQPGAHAAGGGARPVGIRRPRAGRTRRRLGVSADRPAHLSADLPPYRLLLVPAGRRGGGLAVMRIRQRRNPCPNIRPSFCAAAWPTHCSPAAPLLEREILPAYLAKRRWFAMKDQTLQAVRLGLAVPSAAADNEMLLAEIETETQSGTARWLLPLAIAWDERPTGPLPTQLALARVRRGARVGLLTDAFALPEFAQAVMARTGDAAGA